MVAFIEERRRGTPGSPPFRTTISFGPRPMKLAATSSDWRAHDAALPINPIVEKGC